MHSITEFNKYASSGKQAAEKYCRDWATELDAKGKDLSEQYKLKKIDAKTYNQKRVFLNTETKDLNSCIEKVKKPH